MFAEHGVVELVFLAAVALIVVGPKDLPVLMRRIGQFTAKMRGLAAEFRSSFEELARQSELDELRKEVEALRTGQSLIGAHQTEIEQHFDELHHSLNPPPAYIGAHFHAGAEPEDETPDLFAHTPAPTHDPDFMPVEHSPREPEPALAAAREAQG